MCPTRTDPSNRRSGERLPPALEKNPPPAKGGGVAEKPSAGGRGAAQGPAISQPSRGPRRPSMVLGGLLVLIGAILLAGQFVRVDIGHYGWPFFVVAPGILILFVAPTARAAVSERPASSGRTVPVSG